MRRICALFFSLAMLAGSAQAQVYTSGADPASIKWKSLETNNFRVVYPEAQDSLAREYAKSLESFVECTRPSLGFSPNELYKKKFPVILHGYAAVANGMVSWSPRRMELFTNPDFYEPESTPWITQLTVHEGRHVAQMQFPRKNRLFKPLEIFLGELSTGLAVALYPNQVLLEGDAVAAETALTNSGRGRTYDFLGYYHVALADSLYRDFWQWRYGSQKRYTPDYYRAGYMLVAGMRTVYDDALFSKRYYENVNSRFLPFNVLQRTVIEGSKKNLYGAFIGIQDAFRAEWAAADSARAPFFDGKQLVKEGRLYDIYKSFVLTDTGMYALHAALDKATELVKIDPSGKVEEVTAFASGTSRLAFDRFTRRLIWSEYKPSALLGLKSWSVLRYMEEDGRKHNFKLKGRFYNPATNDSRPLMAVVENHVDGSNSVVLISTDKGSIQEEYPAPAGLQPVEPVWLGEELYASAISEDGFSIYHLPDWKPVFAPAHSKINSLFARDGQIWFTSDRSGVNELHSLDPASGELLQRSNLRFGGEDFAFSQDGSLWYSAPTADARVVRRLAPGALQAKPVEFNPIQIASAEKLSSQEASGALPYDGPISEGKRYSKFFQPIRPHSWVPLYIEYDPVERLSLEETETSGNLGATLMFQNELGTAWGSVGVSLLDSLSFRPGLHAQYVWTGWGPIIDFRADYNERGVHRTDYSKLTTEEGITFPQTNSVVNEPFLSVSAGISLPFNLSGGGWNTGIVPSYRLSWNNDQISSVVAERFTNNLFVGIAQNDFCLLSRFSLRAYSVRPKASSAIMPRVGAGAELGFTLSHNLSSDHPGYYYGKFYGYLPGLMSTHGIKLSASGRSNYGWEGDWIKERLCTLEADYAFPFLPLDWTALCPFFYVRNLEAILHCGAELRAYEEPVSLNKGSSHETFAGATLRAHLGNFLWAPYDTYLGVRYIHSFNDPSLSGAEMVFSIDM